MSARFSRALYTARLAAVEARDGLRDALRTQSPQAAEIRSAISAYDAALNRLIDAAGDVLAPRSEHRP